MSWVKIKLDFSGGGTTRESAFVRILIRKDDGGQPYIFKLIFDGYQNKMELLCKLRGYLLSLNDESPGTHPNDKFDLLVQLQVFGQAQCSVSSKFADSEVKFYKKKPSKNATDELFLELLRMVINSL